METGMQNIVGKSFDTGNVVERQYVVCAAAGLPTDICPLNSGTTAFRRPQE